MTEENTMGKHAPLGVKILSILEYVAGAFWIIIGVIAFSRSARIYELIGYRHGVVVTAGHPVLGLIFIVLGIIHLFLGSGLWQGMHWAYIWTVVVSVLYVLLEMAMLIRNGYTSYVSLALNVIILVYLWSSPKAKAYLS